VAFSLMSVEVKKRRQLKAKPRSSEVDTRTGFNGCLQTQTHHAYCNPSAQCVSLWQSGSFFHSRGLVANFRFRQSHPLSLP